MSSINALLNHKGPAPAPRESSASASASASQSQSPPAYTIPTTTYEAADALTTLATLGSGQQYAPTPTRALPSPTAIATAPRRSSSFGSHHDHDHNIHNNHTNHDHEPVEPEPELAAHSPAIHSPTLDHYHHASHSRSPEEQKRRQSLLTDPAPVLAPIRATEPVSSPTADTATAETATAARETPTDTHEPAANTTNTNNTTSLDIDIDTRNAIDAAKATDLGLRSKPAPSKKRPAPPSSSAAKKKGTAKTTKPSNKKRKLDDDTSARSLTPTSRTSTSKPPKSRSHAGTPTLHSSPAPDDAAFAHDDDDADSSEDHNLYCICKKPDNHKWMIGCDGGCDDWFHGDCVDMKQADENLVDKFICPLCEEAGRGHTTWKPMCRRDGCRKPARLAKDNQSKYCSEECGVLFMQLQLQRTAGAPGANGTKDKKKKKKVVRPGEENRGDGDDDDDEPTPLGGLLRAKDLKALVDASPNIQAFRNLGSGVLSPPHTASPTRPNFPANPDDVALTAAETERLTALHNEKSQLNDRLQVLKDREKFVSMAKEQATRVADREKMKLKEFCGYDSRLSWSDAEFLLWRNSPHGRAAFDFSTLSPTPEQVSSITPESTDDTSNNTETVCLKKRCAKHPQWQKLNLQDARFEELEVVESIKECEKEERSVRERARRRNAKDDMARELTAGDGEGDTKPGTGAREVRNREGWVQVVAT